jgi:hypothetical protein
MYLNILAALGSAWALLGHFSLMPFRALAERVQQILANEPPSHDYWVIATEAELQLIRAKYPEAGKLYEAAVAIERKATGNHKTTWKQACRLMAKLQPSESDRASVRKAFNHLPECDRL